MLGSSLTPVDHYRPAQLRLLAERMELGTTDELDRKIVALIMARDGLRALVVIMTGYTSKVSNGRLL